MATTACVRGRDDGLAALQREFLDFPPDVAPLFVLGDVNDDGKVDPVDRDLISRLASGERRDSGAVACFAAADITLDGEVDGSDVVAFQRIAGDSVGLASLVLYAQPHRACSYGKRLIAAPVEWSHARPLRIYLLQGQTTERVALSVLRGAGEAQAMPNKRGWEIRIRENVATDSLITIVLTVASVEFSYTMANFSAATQVVKADPERWLHAGRTDMDGDGDADDLFLEPPPIIFGEEIANVGRCPQQGQGCEALIIDVMRSFWFPYDADKTKDAITSVGCNLTYVAPSFVVMPRAFVHRVTLAADEWVEVPADSASTARAAAANRAEWLRVRAAVARHRANVAAGKELVFQLVHAHGSDVGGYGSWGPGFDASLGDLSRGDFHQGNYVVTRGEACYAVAVDWSCHSGNTPRALERLNNTGRAIYYDPPVTMNHGFHAAFWGDMASATSPAAATCKNKDIAAADARLAEIILSDGRNSDIGQLALGFRRFVIDESVAKYNDRGYNLRADTRCQQASHESSY